MTLLAAWTTVISAALLGFGPPRDPEEGPGIRKPRPGELGTVLEDPFRQLEELLPTPNETRAPSGAPGHRYWQQRADYDIKVSLDDATQTLSGSEKIVYHNESPDELSYLWLQLDQNIFAKDADSLSTSTSMGFDRISFRALEMVLRRGEYDGTVKLGRVLVDGKPVKFTVVKTMMRLDLEKPLPSRRKAKIEIEWSYKINDARMVGGRTGYERFEKDKNYIYEIAQWFPRMAAYNDVSGWQHKQYLGSGEFTLEFGDYHVEITVPEDHVVAATGVLQNPNKVLSKEQRDRLAKAKSAKRPVFVVTPDEAKRAQSGREQGRKTWVYEAKNVRDFAFASSRKFIWDAQGHRNGKDVTMAMSYYPIEGEPMWSKFSTPAIVHTLQVYSRYTFEYPYPTAISVNGPIGGMEYPMICFNGPRPEEDGTYSERTKAGLIGVIIHEVGHNYFPMIVNSDERQWTWMDEGLNTFLQVLSEREWDARFPSRRGEPRLIVDYMRGDDQVPIMTNSESLLQFGNNAYAKPATALVILRETILGRPLFDHAFKTYAQRWKFKRPMPSDFFRTMEDASGVDLDWFWRGWFYSTAHVDLAITGLHEFQIDTEDPDIEKGIKRVERDSMPEHPWTTQDKGKERLVDRFPELLDFYDTYDPLDVKPSDKEEYQKHLKNLEEKERALLASGKRFYVVDLSNEGGLVMPVILELEYADGSKKVERYPAEIWRRSPRSVQKLILSDKEIVGVVLDPLLETADVDTDDNYYPRRTQKSRFKVYKDGQRERNPMQQAGLGNKSDASSGDASSADAGSGSTQGNGSSAAPAAPRPEGKQSGGSEGVRNGKASGATKKGASESVPSDSPKKPGAHK